MCAGLDVLPCLSNLIATHYYYICKIVQLLRLRFGFSTFLNTISEAKPFSRRFDVGHQTILGISYFLYFIN